MRFDENSLPLEICPDCGSYKVRFDSAFGFYKCESCSAAWACDADDPDYDEIVDHLNLINKAITVATHPPDEPN